jgi:hypothetical protein
MSPVAEQVVPIFIHASRNEQPKHYSNNKSLIKLPIWDVRKQEQFGTDQGRIAVMNLKSLSGTGLTENIRAEKPS